MNVLVLGGTGFLSGAVVKEAQNAGHAVTIVTRGKENRPAPPTGVTVLTADRSDEAALEAAVQSANQFFDLVIDCVLFKPDDARAAVRIFQDRAACYVFISTDFVYGGEPRFYPIREDAPRHALSSYGVNKAACEDVFFTAQRETNFPAVVLRPPHIMGRGSLLGTGSLEGRDPWILWRLENNQPILLLDNGELLIQPVHKTDIARAALAVAEAKAQTVGKAYNMAGPDYVTTRRYYEMVCDASGLPPENLVVAPLASPVYLAAYPDRAPFAQNRAYSLDALQADAHFAPTISLADCIAEVVAEYKEKGDPAGDPPQAKTAFVNALGESTERLAHLLKDAA